MDEREIRLAQGNNDIADTARRSLIGESYPGRLSYSLQRGVRLLMVFADGSKLHGVAELADLTGLSRPTVHRYASTLVQLRYLEQGPLRKYRLASGASDPGAEVIREIRHALPPRAVLEELRDQIGYTVSIGLLDGTRVLYVHRLFGHRHGQHMIDRELRVGAYIPAYCTALGKAMLASLPGTERSELVETIDLVPEGPRSITEQDALLADLDEIDPEVPLVSNEESALGATSIAMTLLRRNIKQPMAIDVTVPSDAYTATQLLKQIGPELTQVARLMSDV
ncbi:MAG TPA: IclR family transcriptional regulator [Solirubrobacteraceae bacterium]|jgi:DNA-binding IclR family transcriptional regulator|nr:IclR family transcriptional regulator [Solirubrobacteraceae bacterium]